MQTYKVDNTAFMCGLLAYMKKKPTLKIWADGTKEWRLNGKLHREDGPAVEWADGTKEWRLNGKLHREDGPAVEYADGSKAWYLNGKRHREDGPAFEWANGTKEWWLNDKQVDPKELVNQGYMTEKELFLWMI